MPRRVLRPVLRPVLRRLLRGERGAGSVVAVGILAVVLGMTGLSIPLGTVLAAKRVTAGAADAAALAAAEVAVGRSPGSPCTAAETVAVANGTDLGQCRPDGLVITVRVECTVMGFTVASIATAGPPQE